MKKHIMIFVNTEYHLLIAVNQILSLYNDQDKYFVEIFIKGKRLNQALDFSHLPVSVKYFDLDLSINEKISDHARTEIDALREKNPDIFIFCQEQDPLMVILSGHYAKSGSEVHLYQEGLKPYINLKYHSLGLLKYHHKQNLWLLANGFPVESWLSPIYSKKYAFLKGITKIFLTNPESYGNWNHKHIEKIDFLPPDVLNPALKKLFNWDDALLPEREKIIFYMNQPMHDDGKAETEFLESLQQKYTSVPIYIKLHPLTDKIKLEKYKTLNNAKIIHSKIPAELFIMNLKRSIILSVHSTSMLLNNPENKFYYLYKFFDLEIPILKRHELKKIPSDHIILVNEIEDIKF